MHQTKPATILLTISFCLGGTLFSPTALFAQTPGMSAESEGENQKAVSRPILSTAALAPQAGIYGKFLWYWNKFMGEESPDRGTILWLLTVVVLSCIYRESTHSDFNLGKKLCLEVTDEGLPKENRDGGHGEPSFHCEKYEGGILIRLRYETTPADRQMISTERTRIILEKFKQNYDAVRVAFPNSAIHLRTDFVVGDSTIAAAAASEEEGKEAWRNEGNPN